MSVYFPAGQSAQSVSGSSITHAFLNKTDEGEKFEYKVAHAEWAWIKYNWTEGEAASSTTPLVVHKVQALLPSACYVLKVSVRLNENSPWTVSPISALIHTGAPGSPSVAAAGKRGKPGAISHITVADDASLLPGGALRSDDTPRTAVRITTQPRAGSAGGSAGGGDGGTKADKGCCCGLC